MKKLIALNYKFLRQKLNPKKLKFITTSELKAVNHFIGQQRALSAIRFGVGIENQGYNLYAMGPSGIGKRSSIRKFLENEKLKYPTPSDWCYVHNFVNPEKPIALELPAGTGFELQRDMKMFIDEIASDIVAIFEGREYLTEIKKIDDKFNLKRKKLSKRIENDKIPYLYKQQHKKRQEVQLNLTLFVVTPLISKLKKKYKKLSKVIDYINAVQLDIVTHVYDLIKKDEETNILSFSNESPILLKYQVNLIVDNRKQKGAPIITEENPSYSNLICRVEHTTQFGALITNFTLIKAGAIHKANGGFLIIEARKLKKDLRVWESLKRTLYANQVIIDPVETSSSSVKPISLAPEPIPLKLKVILLGDRATYYYLSNHDPDFNELFKVGVDFDEQIERNTEHINLFARLIATFAKRENIRPLHANAVAEIIDYSTRLAEDVDKLSAHIRQLNDLILEANYWAGYHKRRTIKLKDVKEALHARTYRQDRAREAYYEEIGRNFILINTHDDIVGQVNCLSVVKVGNFSFGHPTRITVKVSAGKGHIIDIQREISMAGPMHTKAGLIVSHLLSSRYNQNYKLSLLASISFEQIYGMMEGDSASVAELCALLSALSEVPLKQSYAITGSIDQYGNVQVVGGLNEKIEGFYDVCKLKGLNGKQGVIIPNANVKNLMLREDVIEACKTGKFSIFTINTLDDAIFILTGCIPGERNKAGAFPKGSINDLVEMKLKLFYDIVYQKKGNKI